MSIKQILQMNIRDQPNSQFFNTPRKNIFEQTNSPYVNKKFNNNNQHKFLSDFKPSYLLTTALKNQDQNNQDIDYILQKSNKPYLHSTPYSRNSYSPPRSYPYEQLFTYRVPHPVQYLSLSSEELLNVIERYEYQIAILKDYIHQSDMLQRHRIMEIFGFDYPCQNKVNTDQSKQMLKELSGKVKGLIKQNNRLKNQQTANKYDELLLKENEKLRTIIDQLKKGPVDSGLEEQIRNLKKENIKLNQQINKLEEELRKSKRVFPQSKKETGSLDQQLKKARQENRNLKQDILQLEQQLDWQKNNNSNKQFIEGLENQIENLKQENSRLNQLLITKQKENMSKKTLIIEKPPTVIESRKSIIEKKQQATSPKNFPLVSEQELDYTKKQLTKDLFDFSKELQNKYKVSEQKVNDLESKLKNAQRKIEDYDRERKLKVDNTIRKSFLLTTKVMKLQGDHDDQFVLPEEDLPLRKQEGKIRHINRFDNSKTFTKPPSYIDNRVSYMYQTPSRKRQQVAEQIKKNQTFIRNDSNQEIEGLKHALNQSRDSLGLQQLKNRNISEQNQMLKKKLIEAQKQLQEKIERIIILQNALNQLQTQKGQLSKQKQQLIKQKQQLIKQNINRRVTVANPEVQKELRQIIITLGSCNPSNYEMFFKDFDQILAERKYLRQKVIEYQNMNQVHSKNLSKQNELDKQVRQILESKVNQMIQQNKRLINKVSELERELQLYHQEMIKSEIEKLNSIKLSEPTNLNGENAAQWQKIVKNSVQVSLARLYNLQKKIKDQNRVISEEPEYLLSSQTRRLSSKKL